MMGYIYIVTNDINNKVYIGQTSNTISERWQEHRNTDDGTEFHNAIRKYGSQLFHVRQLEECPIEKLNEREIYYIDLYDSYKNGYNMTPGGAGVPGYEHTLADRKKMGEASKRFWDNLTPEDREKFIKYRGDKMKGVPKSEEHKKHLGEARKGKYTKEQNSFYGKHHTQKTKDIISRCNKGRVSNRRKKVKLIELNIVFDSFTEAWKWLTENNLCKTKQPQSTTTQIKDSIKEKHKAYGYHWEEV